MLITWFGFCDNSVDLWMSQSPVDEPTRSFGGKSKSAILGKYRIADFNGTGGVRFTKKSATTYQCGFLRRCFFLEPVPGLPTEGWGINSERFEKDRDDLEIFVHGPVIRNLGSQEKRKSVAVF